MFQNSSHQFESGPNHTKLGEFTGNLTIKPTTYSVYGFRFEVVGHVNNGTVGRIGDPRVDTSISVGDGEWQIGQWKYPFPVNERNGVHPPDVGRTTDDSPRYTSGRFQNVSVRGSDFNWNDEPGPIGRPNDPVRTSTYVTNFSAYAQNGEKKCEVAFHIIGYFANGRWRSGIGPGWLNKTP